jgi:tetratricopeptide (TPR) repeat protein
MTPAQDSRNTGFTGTTPDTADAAYRRGRLLYDVKKWERALAEFQQALSLAPEHVNAHLLAGHCCLHLSRLP